MNVNVPAWAPGIPPDIGASVNIKSLFLASPANSIDATGEIVLVSIIYVPFFAFLKIPSGLSNNYSTSLVFGTLVTMYST